MIHPLSPTAVLPALATFQACTATRVGEALRVLQDVYFPCALPSTVVGAVPVLRQSLLETVPALRPRQTWCLVHQDGVPDSGYASAEEDNDDEQGDEGKERIDGDAIDEQEMENEGEEELDILRSDELERGYAIKWLTGLVKRSDAWVCGTNSSPLTSEEHEARTMRVEDASRLLARFAGDGTPEEALTRTFVFPFGRPPYRRWDVSSPAPPITVELSDAAVDGTDHTAVGLQSWGSAIIFAARICSDPDRYLGALLPRTTIPAMTATCQRRLLELGAGTGLLSITAAQVLSRLSVQAEVKATDYHPSVLENLALNVQHNHSAVPVSVEKLDWCAMPCTEHVGADGGVDQSEAEDEDVYDVVLGADVVYHHEHANWIRGCVGRTLRKGGVFWLIIPLRMVGRHVGLGETVEEAFPGVGEGDGEGKCERLAIVGREEVARVDGVGRADEGGYTLFEIRWVVD